MAVVPWTDVDGAAVALRAGHPLLTTPRPFLRWAGSKRALLPSLVAVLPPRYKTYYEPFLGSGALFFALRPTSAVLGDKATEVIDAFRAVRDHPSEIATQLLAMTPDPAVFYDMRRKADGDQVERGVRFLYLNRTCWNGLYRVNARGEFNVPYGLPKTDTLVDPENLKSCSDLLRLPGVRLTDGDFEYALEDCRSGDLVFLDPPYVTRHNDNGFVDYNETLFAWADQERLARCAERLVRRGVTVIATNAHHDELIRLYSRFRRIPVSRSSTLAANPRKRGLVSEAIFVSR